MFITQKRIVLWIVICTEPKYNIKIRTFNVKKIRRSEAKFHAIVVTCKIYYIKVRV